MNAKAQRLIDENDWGAVSHAFGPADDLLELFEGLVSSTPKTRDEALYELHGNVWHQGTVYSASAPAARVLLALVEDEATPGRAGILGLLQCIATGTSYHEVHQGGQLKATRPQKEMDELVATERTWVAKAHESVREGLPILMRCLEDSVVDVREAASFAVSAFPEDASSVVPGVVARLRVESERQTRLGLILALGQLGRGNSGVEQQLLDLLRANGPERMCAAIGLARILGPGCPSKVEAALREAWANSNDWEAVVESTYWNAEMDYEARIEEALELIRK